MSLLLNVFFRYLYTCLFSYLYLLVYRFDNVENKFVGDKKSIFLEFFTLQIFLFLLLLVFFPI